MKKSIDYQTLTQILQISGSGNADFRSRQHAVDDFFNGYLDGRKIFKKTLGRKDKAEA